MTPFPHRVPLGRSGLSVGKLGVASSYGAPASAFREAFEWGANCFYRGSLRRQGMRDAIREIVGGQRDDLVVVLQSHSRFPWMMRRFVRPMRHAAGQAASSGVASRGPSLQAAA